jgi:hypothetical protein
MTDKIQHLLADHQHTFLMKLLLNNGEDKTFGGANGAEQADKVYFCVFQTKNKRV